MRRALALGGVIVIAACGGSARLSHDEYQRALNRELGGLDVRIVHAGNSPRGAETIARDLDAASARLAKLRAPGSAESANGDLADALHAYALDLRDFAVEV